jgi:hypothetical protein
VFDCLTGRRVARDDDPDFGSWEETVHLKAPGIGPLAGQTIQLAGLHGGGLRRMTEDHWSLTLVWLNFCWGVVFLEEPGCFVFEFREERRGGCWKVFEGDIRACGFSPTGLSFVVAEGSHSLYLFSRSPR